MLFPGDEDDFLSSGRNVFEENENRPKWLQTRECLMRKTSKMSPAVLDRSGSWNLNTS